MREFEQKRIIKRRIYSKVTILILLVILFFVARGTIEIYQKLRESNKQLEATGARQAELEKRYANLEEQLLDLQSPVGQEEEVRNRFSLAKEDEHAIFIIDADSGELEPEPERSVISSAWRKITSWFFD